MKKIILPFVLVLCVFIANAQVPEAFSYQAVVRDVSGGVINNKLVSFRVSILTGSSIGQEVYSETHSVSTNDFGLANLKIGMGENQTGIFSPGGWGLEEHFIKVELDVNGGNSFVLMGTSQLLSVPYAFHAQTVEEDKVEDADADATNELQTISLSGTNLTLSDGGGTVSFPSTINGDKWGTQTVVSNATLTGNGTSASPLSVDGDLTDDQTLSISGNDLSISGGNTVTLPSASSQWIRSGDHIYYDAGKVAVGELKPTWPQLFQVVDDNEVIAMILSNTSSAGLDINRNSSNSSSSAQIMFDTDEIRRFRIGLLSGSTNFRISSSLSSLVGIEVEPAGNVKLSNNLNVQGSTTLGPSGVTFTEMREFTGTTGTGYQKLVSYPSGYNYTNTRVLSLEIKWNDTMWCSMGQHVGTQTGDYKISSTLTSSGIYIYYGEDASLQNRPFRMILMKVQ